MDTCSTFRCLTVKFFLLLVLFSSKVFANIRCYSCAPCNELEWYSGSTAHFEQDCYIDRYCMKISGISTDLFGYKREVNIRGCPMLSLITRLEEGCTGTGMEIGGIGRIEGKICYCSTPLCNQGTSTTPSILSFTFLVLIYLFLL